jgi:hypothetical protein
MHHRTSRTNHVLLSLLGLLLLAVGAFALARYYDWFGRLPSTDRLYSRPEARWLHSHDWIWIVVAAAAILVGLLALRWLLVQPRLDRVHTLRVDADPGQTGRTSMSADVLTDAVEDDLVEVPGVNRARVLLIGAADEPEIVVRVTANPLTDLGDVRRRIAEETLPAARTALDVPDAPAQLHVQVTGRKVARRIVL